ncbi:hypothetical protein AB0H88_37645 [Nonomuraea sp. NPDC050680]|uniref:hypothetical protein n=1 Tax=Nonomuraea sp. NPDC050680 TaxID=3154630 RepID=UPI0033CD1835
MLCTGGGAPPSAEQQAILTERGIAVRPEPIERLEGPGASLERIVLPSVLAAGDMARRPAMPLSGSLAVIAAAGLLAAVLIDQGLLYAARP